MGTEHAYFSNEEGTITGHISWQTIDATFKYKGAKMNMYFHRYLGPSFFLLQDGVEQEIYPDENDVDLWKQFDGWWKAKGKALYL